MADTKQVVACASPFPPGYGTPNEQQALAAVQLARDIAEVRQSPGWGLVQDESAEARVGAQAALGAAKDAESLRAAQAAYRATFALDALLGQVALAAQAAHVHLTALAKMREMGRDPVALGRARTTQFTGESAIAAIEAARQAQAMVQTPAWQRICQMLTARMAAHWGMAELCDFAEVEYHRQVVKRLSAFIAAVQAVIDRGTDAAMWFETEAEVRGKER